MVFLKFLKNYYQIATTHCCCKWAFTLRHTDGHIVKTDSKEIAPVSETDKNSENILKRKDK